MPCKVKNWQKDGEQATTATIKSIVRAKAASALHADQTACMRAFAHKLILFTHTRRDQDTQSKL
jgi:hypothetical protein